MGKNYDDLVNYVMLRSSYVHDLGLFHGKMGIAVALWLLARETKDETLEDYSWNLFQQVHDGLGPDMPMGLSNGLVGIGVGTTLLCKHGLIDCDLNEILANVDARLMEYDPRRIADLSLYTGAQGIQLYLQLRREVGGVVNTFDGRYLSELCASLGKDNAPVNASLLGLVHKPSYGINEYAGKPLGIDGGSSYYLLKQANP